MSSEIVKALKAWDTYDPNISEEKVLRQAHAVIDAARPLLARLEALEAENAELRKKLSGCQWYWPEDDTSSEACADSAQGVVQNIYDWSHPEKPSVIAVARGGVVEVTYCAALPPADDAGSDDDFWIEAETEEAAQAMLDAEIARRAREGGNEDG